MAQLVQPAPDQAEVVDPDPEMEAQPDPAAAHPDAARLPPELAEAPPGEVDPSIKARRTPSF